MVNSWAVCLVVSVAYFVIFIQKAHGRLPDNGLLFGFCVWGTPNTPNEEHGCYKPEGEWKNSHTYSCFIDVVLTMIVARLYLSRPSKRIGLIRKQQTTPWFVYLAIGLIILMHGLLHLFLYKRMNCFEAQDDIPPWLNDVGYVLLGLFTVFLCFILLYIGFVNNGQGEKAVFVASVVCGISVVWLTKGTGTEWILPALFAVSHPLSSITGLLSKSPVFTQSMGWVFLVATVMGVLELTECLNFFRAIGGHLWYDVWLGMAMIMTLPPFAPEGAVFEEAGLKKL